VAVTLNFNHAKLFQTPP